jgi:uncharacterized protein YdeI (YjbR/CyaY-like superfamily)
MSATFLDSPAAFRKWLEENHGTATELLLGFHKKGSGKASITYAEALDEALCFGWIDGVRKSLGETSYMIRFTPRKQGSIWSNVNIKHVERLMAAGRMRPPGIKAFEARDPAKSGVYLYENEARELSADLEERFKADPQAWEFFQSQAPSYQRTIKGWIMAGKKEETRFSRLVKTIEASTQGRRL